MSTSDDQAAFLRQLEEHRGIVSSVAFAYCRDRGAREDVVQSISAELWRAYPRYDGRVAFSTWMYRVAVNAAISYYRRQTRERSRLVDPADFESLPAASEDDGDVARRTTLYRLIDGLDELERALILLYLDGNNHAEIADVLGISQTNVATKISRIKQSLRRSVASDVADD